MNENKKSTEELLEDWLRRTRESQFAHFGAANSLSKTHLYLGIPAVVLSTAVGTTIFASLQEKSDTKIQIAIGTVSLLTATIVALQTFLKLEERAEKHRTAGAAYGSVRREIQQLLHTEFGDDMSLVINPLRSRLDDLALESPKISERIWKATENKLSGYVS